MNDFQLISQERLAELADTRNQVIVWVNAVVGGAWITGCDLVDRCAAAPCLIEWDGDTGTPIFRITPL